METPRYTQPEVLRVTRLKPKVLQTWLERGIVELADHNPGSGRRRLYARVDVVKLAIMRRMADLQVALAVSVKIAEASVARLLRDTPEGSFPWDLQIFLRPNEATQLEFEIAHSGDGRSPLARYSPIIADPRLIRLDLLLDPLRLRRYRGEENKIDEVAREAQARFGIHAEPVLVIPLGEIVNGTLAQLRAIDSAEDKRDA